MLAVFDLGSSLPVSQFPHMQANNSNSYLCLLPLVEEDEMWLSGEESPSVVTVLLKGTGV